MLIMDGAGTIIVYTSSTGTVLSSSTLSRDCQSLLYTLVLCIDIVPVLPSAGKNSSTCTSSKYSTQVRSSDNHITKYM